MTKIYNRIDQKEKRRNLRSNMPNAEKIIWEKLRRRQVKSKRFLRQFSIGKYVIDFYFPELKLAIEVDGNTHSSDKEIQYDKKRQMEVEILGIKFLRFRNEEIFENINEVIKKIVSTIEEINK